MTKRLVTAGTWVDDALEDGYLRVGKLQPGGWRKVTMSPATYEALGTGGVLHDVYSVVETLPKGLHLIPRIALDPDAANETRRAVEILEPEVAPWCFYPHCQQPVFSTERGFSACQIHDADLRDWDSLVA